MTDVLLPARAWQDVDAGTEALVDEWLVREGDRVKAGQTIAAVVLVKTRFDIEAPADGVLDKILVPKDGTFKPGQPLARVTP
jgi:pyruvate/2-oxoglutarate dehydrogenase complex dihydrolipoamide acyltransferase (E2) component